MSSQFDKLSKYSSIVADTSELSLLKSLYAEDATTNPSLILKAANLPEYQHLIGKTTSPLPSCPTHHPDHAHECSARILYNVFLQFEDDAVAFGQCLKLKPKE